MSVDPFSVFDQLATGEDARPAAVTSLEEGVYASFGLSSNPYPPNRSIDPEVLHNQERVKERFAALVTEFVSGIRGRSAVRLSMGLIGGTGSGKSHFLQRARYELERGRGKEGQSLSQAYGLLVCHWKAQRADMAGDLGVLFNRVSDFVEATHGQTLLPVLVNAFREGHPGGVVPEPPAELRNVSADLRNGLASLLRLAEGETLDPNRKVFDRERVASVLEGWLMGSALSEAEKRYLRISINLRDPSLRATIHRDVYYLATLKGFLGGIVLFVDEVEPLFTEVGPGRRNAYLQGLRHFYEAAQPTLRREEAAYNLLTVSASSPDGAKNLGAENYPVYQRLGFEGEARAELEPISSVSAAIEFAFTYIDHAHEKWLLSEEGRKATRPAHTLLSNAEIERAYNAARATREAGIAGVPQGPLLDSLHRAVEEKVKVEMTERG